MNIGKLVLWGGLGYLGYKLFASPYAPGDTAAVNLVEAAKTRLDPEVNWEIAVQRATGAVSFTGRRSDGSIIYPTQTFANQAAALAWVTGGPTTGRVAPVTYFTV